MTEDIGPVAHNPGCGAITEFRRVGHTLVCKACGDVVAGPEALADDGPHETLRTVREGERLRVTVDDFENARFPKDENPRTIEAKVELIKEDVSHSAGEIVRAIQLGNPGADGCYIDVGDKRENNMTRGSHDTPPDCYYHKAWRPHRNAKDRRLLGRVVEATAIRPEIAEEPATP